MDKSARIAIVGAGIAGLTVAGLLQKQGYKVSVYEQAESFWRIGAGIILGASTAKVMRRLGLEDGMVKVGICPDAFVSRDVETGSILNELVFDAAAQARFGGPFVNIHRADLHRLLVSALAPDTIHFSHHLAGIAEAGDHVALHFANGKAVKADIVIGADGIRSVVRDMIQGYQSPRYIGKIALRAVFPRARAAGVPMRDCTKWWGDDRHLLSYFMTDRRDECYVMAAVPSDAWNADSAPTEGTPEDFLAAFPNAHPDLKGLLEATDNITILPICDRVRNDVWSEGRITLMGDACHAVRPFMAAGGSMAIEDAALLAQAIDACGTPEAAFALYQEKRIPRVGDVQRISVENSWLREPGDTSWFFGYDPFSEKMEAAA